MYNKEHQLFTTILNLRTNCYLEKSGKIVDQHTSGQWFIYATKHHKDKKSQSLNHPAEYASCKYTTDTNKQV